jgi:hypothetical protein
MKNRPLLTILAIFVTAISAFAFFKSLTKPDEVLFDSKGNYIIDPEFQSFYGKIGGVSFCGEPLTGKYLGDYGYYEQITTNCLLYSDVETSEILLAPLGILLNLYSESGTFQSIPVHPNISQVYYETITPKIAGDPISSPEFDTENNLWKQNFENISIALQPDTNSFQLLSLGEQYCEKKGCKNPYSDSTLSASPQSINEFIKRYPEFGSVVLGEYVNEYDVTEYIFNGIVLYLQNDKVYLKKLPASVGFEPADLEDRISNDLYKEKLFHFFYVRNNLGYNIPAPILDYINQYLGGTRVSGPPISGNHLIVKNITEVCFTAYCLRYNLEEGKIRIANLGVTYYDQVFNQQKTSEPELSENYENLSILITMDNLILNDKDQSTTAHVLLFYNQVPMVGVIPNIFISDRQSSSEYQMPSTDGNGETVFVIDGNMLPDTNGVVKISVCVYLENETNRKCVDGKNLQLTFSP